MEDPKSTVISELYTDRQLAHHWLFPHRHKQISPDYHKTMIDRLHDDSRQDIFEIFRNGGKSTLAEESRIIRALLGEFKNGIIIGSSWERAVERLRSIRHEFESNERIRTLFGDMLGGTWTESRLVLKNGVALQAYGRGQSLRGAKHLDQRPDDCLCDDFEDDDSTRTEEAIERCMSWFYGVLLPALDVEANMDILGTPMDPQSVVVKLGKNKEWRKMSVPIEYLDEDGVRRSSWPGRYPMEWIERKHADYVSMGRMTQWAQEYMCKAEDEALKPFHAGMIRHEARVRTWEPVYAFYDPARTTKVKTSAQTGVAVWSWVANRLIVWDAYGRFWKPDEIYEDIFRVQDTYHPVEIGVEEDSLNEFIFQPLRGEMVKRGTPIPIRPMKAPPGKEGFIKGLAPYFKAGEIIFAKPLPELEAQLLNFPNDLKDVLNALAYALRMRPGAVIYEDFSTQNVQENIYLEHGEATLALNCTESLVTAVLLQYRDGSLKILADWVEEGDAGQRLPHILESASQLATDIKLRASVIHFDRYRNRGLVQAAHGAGRELARGGDECKGREQLRKLLTQTKRGLPALQINSTARWTLNAFAGGYAKEVGKNNMVKDDAVNNHYRVLMEGLESFCGVLSGSIDSGNRDGVHYARTADGREYMSAMAKRL